MDVVVLGLSISSSWGNGHATNYRALCAELVRRGHRVTFLERDMPWYAAHRDLPDPPGIEFALYATPDELAGRADTIAAADLVIVGSYVPDGVAVLDRVLDVAEGTVAFYDIDTPVTLAKLGAGDEEYLARRQLAAVDLYLSFTGGPTLDRLADLGVRRPVAFHCLVDPAAYAAPAPDRPGPAPRWELGYLGTWSADRQPGVDALLLEPARRRPDRRFVVAGPQYPEAMVWPDNVERIDHLAPAAHAAFYRDQRFTLSVTRAAMRAAGHSPSVRLFEAAAAGVPIITDAWPGVETFFVPGEEILVADTAAEVIALLDGIDDAHRAAIAAAARARVLAEHTPSVRIDQLEAELAALAPRSAQAVGSSQRK